MIDEFTKYVSNYDLNNIKIKMKYNHSMRVMKLANKYAKLLGFNKEDVELATTIGLLHDIGRFEQVRVYDSFVDKDTVDHADLSVLQLFRKGEIKLFCDKEEWYPIIEVAIKYHNKFELPETTDERILKHVKLIKDVDKLDILFLYGIPNEYYFNSSDDEISLEVMDAIRKHQLVNRVFCKTINDRVCTQYAFAFEIYNDVCLKEYKKNYLVYNEIVNKNHLFDEVNQIVLNYINERIDNYDGNRN